MQRLVLSALVAAALVPAAPAAAQKPTDRSLAVDSCFFVRDVGDRTIGDPTTLYFKVKDQAHMHAIAYYKVKVDAHCQAGILSNDEHHGFDVGTIRLASHRAAQICSVADLRVRVGKGPTCVASSMTRMTPVEVAALPSGLKP